MKYSLFTGILLGWHGDLTGQWLPELLLPEISNSLADLWIQIFVSMHLEQSSSIHPSHQVIIPAHCVLLINYVPYIYSPYLLCLSTLNSLVAYQHIFRLTLFCVCMRPEDLCYNTFLSFVTALVVSFNYV